MNETNTRTLAEVLGDIEAHKKECAAAHVPANAEKLLRLVLEAVSFLGEIKAASDLATASANEALRLASGADEVREHWQKASSKADEAHGVAIEARDAARIAMHNTKQATKPAAKKAAAKKAA